MSLFSITGSRCNDCHKVIVPPRETCPYCGRKSGPMEIVELPSRGIVQSHTTLQVPPEGFRPPLLLALVELEFGAMILCLAKASSEPSVKIGDEVDIEVDDDGRFCYHSEN